MNECLNELSHCVYILLCADKTTYTGYSTRLDARLIEHRKGEVKYTSTRLVLIRGQFSTERLQFAFGLNVTK